MRIFVSLSGRDILYHTTSNYNLLKILKNNKFRLSFVAGTKSDMEHNKNKFFYMSFSRSPIGKYNLDPYAGYCQIVIDGRKLSHKYQIHPVDYWGPDFRKVDPRSHEMEERLVTDKQFIPNAKSYIKEVHALIPESYEDRLDELKALKSVLKNKLFVYNDKKAFRLLNKRKAIDIEGSFKKVVEFSKKLDNERPDVHTKYINRYIELFDKYNEDDLSEKSRRLLWDLDYPSFKRSIDADLHNAKKSPIMGDFARRMRKHKLQTTQDFVDYLKNKWKPQR